MLRPDLITLLAGLGACSPGAAQDWELIDRFPHDTQAYTQGLLYQGGVLLESTGLYRESEVRRVELRTGRVLTSVALPDDRFGEGIALLGTRLYQVTWKSGTGYVYDLRTLSVADSFHYEGEGWGLTSDGELLILSDGTPTLRFLDPGSFAVLRQVTVQEGTAPLSQLNELEYVQGEILANVYGSSLVARIDPETGQVRGWLDFESLVPPGKHGSQTDVLNGIAFDPGTGSLYLTGKRWPVVYQVKLGNGRGSGSVRAGDKSLPRVELAGAGGPSPPARVVRIPRIPGAGIRLP